MTLPMFWTTYKARFNKEIAKPSIEDNELIKKNYHQTQRAEAVKADDKIMRLEEVNAKFMLL
jgi:hypothetical protein